MRKPPDPKPSRVAAGARLTTSGIALVVIAAILGCHRPSSDAMTADTPPDVGALPEVDASSGAECQPYPARTPDDPGAELVARARLAQIDPAALMSWNPRRFTLSSIAGNLAMPACVGRETVQDHAMSLVTSSADLFRMIPAEWGRGAAVTCDAVTATAMTCVGFGRRRFGGHTTLWSDLINFCVRRVGAVPTVVRVDGDYAPPITDGLAAQLSACEGQLTHETVVLGTAQLRQFGFLHGVDCNLNHEGAYQPNQADAVTFESDPVFGDGMWTRMHGATELRYVRRAWLRIHQDNLTTELRHSNANCFGAPIGFELVVDGVTGDVLDSVPGLGCTVCDAE